MSDQKPNEGQSVEKISIPDLGEFTPDEIREWKQGYLRQSDYTKKTQELAEERKKLQASQIPDPATVQQTDNAAMVELEKQVQKLSIETELAKMKGKYPDFNEVAVLDKAIELMNKGTPASAIDWEMIHKSQSAVNADAIRKEIIEKIQAGGDVSSIIGGHDNLPQTNQPVLSPEEDKIRIKMNMTVEDWVKYK